jgi:single-strand DNA-binding protein
MNNVSIVGRVGNDPEIKEKVVKFSIATNDGFGDSKKTNWHNIVAFGKQKDIIAQYVKKGNQLAITGRIDYNKSDDGRVYTSIILENFTLLSNSAPSANQPEPETDLPF